MLKRIISAIIAFAVCASFIVTVTLCTAAENGYYHTPDGACYGDIDSDGKVNLLDLILLRKYLAKWNVSIDVLAADVTADSKVNLPDLILLRKYLAKWDVMLGKPNDTTTAPETTQNVSLPELRELSITTSQIDTFRYLLCIPSAPAKNMPLVVYLHGGSGKGDDLELLTELDGFPKYLKTGQLWDIPAYVVIPQLPSDIRGWAEAADSVISLIRSVKDEYMIDENNISLTGHSMGGTGTWSLAAAYPNTFARIAPLSGSIKNTAVNVNKLKNIPVRAFVGTDDTIVPPESSQSFINALKSAGGNAEITELDGADHFAVPALTYLNNDYHIIDWLIGKS